MLSKPVVILGSFVADVAFRTPRLPAWGETLLGESFALGPGGKGSNQAVAAARAGAAVTFLSKLGDDAFGRMARNVWSKEGIDASHVAASAEPTGAAAILLYQQSGENAIVVVPGACFTLTSADVEAHAQTIRDAAVFLTQLELPLEAVECGLRIARAAGVTTILNPAPASPLPDSLLALCDFVIPNEAEASLLNSGEPVRDITGALRAAEALRARGVRNVIVTCGAMGSVLLNAEGESMRIDAVNAGPVRDTSGAGDAFCGAFTAALAEGQTPGAAARFASASAGISVTRAGTALSMPRRYEIDVLL